VSEPGKTPTKCNVCWMPIVQPAVGRPRLYCSRRCRKKRRESWLVCAECGLIVRDKGCRVRWCSERCRRRQSSRFQARRRLCKLRVLVNCRQCSRLYLRYTDGWGDRGYCSISCWRQSRTAGDMVRRWGDVAPARNLLIALDAERKRRKCQA
jgi:hypothetical protein